MKVLIAIFVIAVALVLATMTVDIFKDRKDKLLIVVGILFYIALIVGVVFIFYLMWSVPTI